MKVAISTSSFATADSAPLDLLHAKGVNVISNPFSRKLTEDEIINHLEGVDGLVAGLEPLNNSVFTQCPQLKAIARVGIGMDNVDMEAADKADILVSNTPDGPTDAVAEMTLSAALALSRDILYSNTTLHNKEWKKSIGLSLKHAKVLFIGYGRIGRKAAELFCALGSQIMIYDPVVDINDMKLGEKLVELKEGFATADIITLHAGGNKSILTTTEFEQMQNGVIILNSARGELIDEKALITALDSGKVASAWLDVFSEEPYTGKLTEYEQVLLTPHISTYTIQCRRDMEITAVNNLLRDLGIN